MLVCLLLALLVGACGRIGFGLQGVGDGGGDDGSTPPTDGAPDAADLRV